MKPLVRILVIAVVTIALIVTGLVWVAPTALSFYAARKAPAVTRVVPAELKDNSISQGSGTRLSYFGYEFEVPWADLDQLATQLYPKDKSEKNKADLRFRSGLRLVATVVPARQFAADLQSTLKLSPQELERALGNDVLSSDYNFMKAVYEFTPDKMHHWRRTQGAHNREEFLLLFKSIVPTKSAEMGIFRIQNPSYRGFQEGQPLTRQNLLIHLFADDSSLEILVIQKDYRDPSGVSQADINRIIQTVRKTNVSALSVVKN